MLAAERLLVTNESHTDGDVATLRQVLDEVAPTWLSTNKCGPTQAAFMGVAIAFAAHIKQMQSSSIASFAHGLLAENTVGLTQRAGMPHVLQQCARLAILEAGSRAAESEVFAKLLSTSSSDVRFVALESLGAARDLGHLGDRLLTALLDVLINNKEELWVQCAAGRILGRWCLQNEEASLPECDQALLQILKIYDGAELGGALQIAALPVLAQLARQAIEAVPPPALSTIATVCEIIVPYSEEHQVSMNTRTSARAPYAHARTSLALSPLFEGVRVATGCRSVARRLATSDIRQCQPIWQLCSNCHRRRQQIYF